MTTSSISLFENFTDCNSKLPVNPIIQRFQFGQIIRLVGQINNRTLPIGLQAKVSSFRNLNAAQRQFISIDETIKGIQESHQQTIQEFIISDLDEFLLSKTISVDGRPRKIELDSVKIDKLLKGEPVIIDSDKSGSTNLFQIRAPRVSETKSSALETATPTSYLIKDMSKFIYSPKIPSLNGPFELNLKKEDLANLRSVGKATVNHKGYEIELLSRTKLSNIDPTLLKNFDDIDSPKNTKSAIPPSMEIPGVGSIVLFVAWEQEWELKGFSRGNLLSSISLGPQEETTIELFSWDRQKRTLEQSSSTDIEQSFENNETTKDVTDVVREMTTNDNLQMNANASISVQYPPVTVNVSGGLSSTNNVTNVVKQTTNRLTESTRKAAAKVRINRQSKVTESREFGKEERITRKIKNPNMCYALNLNYFEILANYNITTRFVKEDASICVLCKMPQWLENIDFGSYTVIRKHEKLLRSVILDRNFNTAFDAVKLIVAREKAKELLCEKPKCQTVTPPPSPSNNAPSTDNNQSLSENPKLISLKFALTEIQQKYTELTDPNYSDYRDLLSLWDGQLGPGYDQSRDYSNEVKIFNRYLYTRLLMTLLPTFSQAVSNSKSETNLIISAQLIVNAIPSANSTYTLQSISAIPAELDKIINLILNSYCEGDWSGRERAWYHEHLEKHLGKTPDNNGMEVAVNNLVSAFNAYKSSITTSNGTGTSQTAINQALNQQEQISNADKLESAFPLKDVAEAKERAEALSDHLTQHKDHYKFAIFQLLPLGEQLSTIESSGVPIEFVEPRIVGMVKQAGDTLIAFPLNPALINSANSILNNFIKSNPELTDYTSTKEIVLPTPGIMLENRLGECCGCEDYIKELRLLELAKRRIENDISIAKRDQERLEAERYKLRLTSSPPQLDDPDPNEGVKPSLKVDIGS